MQTSSRYWDTAVHKPKNAASRNDYSDVEETDKFRE